VIPGASLTKKLIASPHRWLRDAAPTHRPPAQVTRKYPSAIWRYVASMASEALKAILSANGTGSWGISLQAGSYRSLRSLGGFLAKCRLFADRQAAAGRDLWDPVEGGIVERVGWTRSGFATGDARVGDFSLSPWQRRFAVRGGRTAAAVWRRTAGSLGSPRMSV
jgi:hypothetical protein